MATSRDLDSNDARARSSLKAGMDRVTVLLLVLASVIAVGASVPSLLRDVAGPMFSPERRVSSPHVLPSPSARRVPAFVFGHEDDDDGEEESAPGPAVDRHPSARPLSSSPRTDAAKMAVAKTKLELRNEPNSSSSVTSEVASGEFVMIMNVKEDWVLVVHSAANGVDMGWARKSDVAFR